MKGLRRRSWGLMLVGVLMLPASFQQRGAPGQVFADAVRTDAIEPTLGPLGTAVTLTGSFPVDASILVSDGPMVDASSLEGNGTRGAPNVLAAPAWFARADGLIPNGVDGVCSMRLTHAGERALSGSFTVEGSGELAGFGGNGIAALSFVAPSTPGIVGYEVLKDDGKTWTDLGPVQPPCHSSWRGRPTA